MIDIVAITKKLGYNPAEISYPEGMKAKSRRNSLPLEIVDVEAEYSEEIKRLDELYLSVDSANLEKEIESSILKKTSALFNDSFFGNYPPSNVIIFITGRYKNKLSNEFLFDNLFKINTRENFRNYIDTNKERLREYIKNTDFYLLGMLEDNKKFFPAIGCADVYYFYTQFHNELNLTPDGWNYIFQQFTIEELKILLVDFLENKVADSSPLLKCKFLIEFLCNTSDIDFDIIFRVYMKTLELNISFVPYIIKFADLEQIYRNKIKNGIEIIDTFTYQFFHKLQVLGTIPPKERKAHPYYEECYKIFSDIIHMRIKDLTEEDLYVVRNLFNRIINGKSFMLISSITNKTSLYFYYKTNMFFENKDNIDLKRMDKIPYKEWTDIVDKFIHSPILSLSVNSPLFCDLNSLSDYIRNLSYSKFHKKTYIPEILVKFYLEFGYEFVSKFLELKDPLLIIETRKAINKFIASP